VHIVREQHLSLICSNTTASEDEAKAAVEKISDSLSVKSHSIVRPGVSGLHSKNFFYELVVLYIYKPKTIYSVLWVLFNS